MSGVAHNTDQVLASGLLFGGTTRNGLMSSFFRPARLVAMLGLPFYLVIYTPNQCGPLSPQDALWYLSAGSAAGYVLWSAIKSIQEEFL